MGLKSVKSLESNLNFIYKNYFKWFRNKENFLKDGVETSHPFFININAQLGGKVNDINSKDIILIYGQETYGYPSKNWVNHPFLLKNNIGEVFTNKNSFNNAININKICSLGYDFPYFNKESVIDFDIKNKVNIHAHFKGPFWNLLKDISQENNNIVWSNILKFDICRPINSKRRIKKSEILKEKKDIFYKKHRDLIFNEIKIINPGKVLFLSSPTEIDSIYNKIISELLEYNNNINHKYMRGGNLLELNIPFVQCFHPRRLNLEERTNLIDNLFNTGKVI